MRPKEFIRQMFEELAAGNRRALLSRTAESAVWRVTGTTAISGVHPGRQAFYENVLRAITSRLTGGVKPTVLRVLEDGEVVTVEWRGESTMLDGRPYNNEYCWILRVVSGKIVEGTIYYDSALVNEILRLPARP